MGHNFSPSEFSNEYNQQCDILDDNDFALSLLNMVPTYNEICSQFHFEHNDSHEFLPRLEPSSEPLLPRIRSMRSTSTQRVRYIEKANNVFAEIKNGMTAWASVYCHHEMSRPMVIMQRDYSVYLPTTLLLPNYIERALYLMNLGLPETRKVLYVVILVILIIHYSTSTNFIMKTDATFSQKTDRIRELCHEQSCKEGCSNET